MIFPKGLIKASFYLFICEVAFSEVVIKKIIIALENKTKKKKKAYLVSTKGLVLKFQSSMLKLQYSFRKTQNKCETESKSNRLSNSVKITVFELSGLSNIY